MVAVKKGIGSSQLPKGTQDAQITLSLQFKASALTAPNKTYSKNYTLLVNQECFKFNSLSLSSSSSSPLFNWFLECRLTPLFILNPKLCQQTFARQITLQKCITGKHKSVNDFVVSCE